MASDEKNVVVIVTPEGPEANRAEVVVHRCLPALSRRQVRELFRLGRVRLDGHPVRKGKRVAGGARLAIELCEAERRGPIPDHHLEIEVLFEDEVLVALNKPAGVPTLPLRVGERGTVANFLAARYPNSPLTEHAFEAGLAHRLDNATSGVILAARTIDAYWNLRDQFRRRRVVKSYLALVYGRPNRAATIRSSIVATGRRNERMKIHSGQKEDGSSPRQAITRFHPVKSLGEMTLVGVQIRTGVRHQIRAHLASVGHPIVGDHLYSTAGGIFEQPDAPRRLFLHARRIRFVHPVRGNPVRIVAPVPIEMRAFLERREEDTSSGAQ